MPGGFVVRDANSQALAYVYSRASETDAMQAKVLTDDEARRVAVTLIIALFSMPSFMAIASAVLKPIHGCRGPCDMDFPT
jgi:hypothetical protein